MLVDLKRETERGGRVGEWYDTAIIIEIFLLMQMTYAVTCPLTLTKTRIP